MVDYEMHCKYCRRRQWFMQQTEYRDNKTWSFFICIECGWQTEAVKFPQTPPKRLKPKEV